MNYRTPDNSGAIVAIALLAYEKKQAKERMLSGKADPVLMRPSRASGPGWDAASSARRVPPRPANEPPA